jgi:hypothetical protein
LSQHTLISINNEVCNATLGRYVLAWKEASLDGSWMVCWHWVSTALGFVHVLLGILIYSSLMFTMSSDAVIVVVRYLASVAVCRLILIFELAGMRSTCRQQSKIGGDDDVALRPLVSGRR